MLLPGNTLQRRNEIEAMVADESGHTDDMRHHWVVEHLPVIVYTVLMKKSQTKFLVSPQCEKLLGYSQEEWSGDPQIWLKILHPGDRERVLSDFLNRSRAGGRVFCTEYRLVGKHGSVFRFRDEGTIVRNEGGLPLLAEGVMLDVTDRKNQDPAIVEDVDDRLKPQDAVLKKVLRYEHLFQSLADGLFIIDREGRILTTNHAASEITGYSEKELVGMNVLELRVHDNPPHTAVRIDSIMRKEINRFEVTCRRKSGEIIHLEVRKNFVDTGDENFFLSFFGDITERKEQETALKKQVDELTFKTRNVEEVNNALRELLKRRDEDKNELEGRVVLNVKELVLPYLEKVKRFDLEPKCKSYVEVLESNLTSIVSPFTTRLSSSLLNLTPTEIRVANLVKEGRSTKEIAELFNLSRRTIDVHRDNIRKKLGIKNKKANLRTHLSYLQ